MSDECRPFILTLSVSDADLLHDLLREIASAAETPKERAPVEDLRVRLLNAISGRYR